MPRNVELKAALADPREAHRTALSLSGADGVTERQSDTYFRAPAGRLKLRRRWKDAGGPGGTPRFDREEPAELIAYRRPDEAGARTSEYVRVELGPRTRVGDALDLALGTEVRVEKTRTVYRWEGVRIHVDEVDGLGAFLEFEAIVGDACDESTARGKVDALRREFGLGESQIVAGSYRELATARG